MWPRKRLCFAHWVETHTRFDIFVRNLIQTTWCNDHLTTLQASTSTAKVCSTNSFLNGQLEGKKCNVASLIHWRVSTMPIVSWIKFYFLPLLLFRWKKFDLSRLAIANWQLALALLFAYWKLRIVSFCAFFRCVTWFVFKPSANARHQFPVQRP